MAKKKEAVIDTTKKEVKLEDEITKEETEKKNKTKEVLQEEKKGEGKKKATKAKKDTQSKSKKKVEENKTNKSETTKNNEEKDVKQAGKKNSKKRVNQANTKKEKTDKDKIDEKTEIGKVHLKEKSDKENSKKKKETKNIEKQVREEQEDTEKEETIVKKEKLISIQEIKETMKKKQNLPKEEIEKINKYLFQNILVAICIMVYFIFLNLGKMNIEESVYVTDLKVFGMCILLLAIALIEKAYKEDDGQIAIYGVEMIVLSIITIGLIYVNLMLSTRYIYIVTSISHIFAIYYLIKSIVIYLKKRKKYFVDDMKEIIQDKEE